MAAKTHTNIHKVTGQLCVGPTDLGTAFPHGGTALGAFHKFHIRHGLTYAPVVAEEYAQAVEFVLVQDNLRVGCFIRGWDNDALATVFPNTTVGGSSGDRVINWPGANATGTLRASSGVKLLFTADRSDLPSLIVYRAVPLIDEQESLKLSILRELQMPVVFEGLRDGSGRVAAMGRLEDLSL